MLRSARVFALAVLALGWRGESAVRARPMSLQHALRPPAEGIVGTSLGPRELALTFDDGPASRTAALSSYLKDAHIAAAFFVNGRKVPHVPVLGQLVADGHVIGNHTQNHLHLIDKAKFPDGPEGAQAMVKELADTDAIIAPYVA